MDKTNPKSSLKPSPFETLPGNFQDMSLLIRGKNKLCGMENVLWGELLLQVLYIKRFTEINRF